MEFAVPSWLSRRQVLRAAAGASVVLPCAPFASPAFAAEVGAIADRMQNMPLIPRHIPLRIPRGLLSESARMGRGSPFWVAPIDDVANARPFTQVADAGIAAELFWMRNNRHVLFFREQDGDENWRTSVSICRMAASLR